LKFRAAKIAALQVNVDLGSICNCQTMTMVTKQPLRGRTPRRFAKIILW
jgi:hypothetical protein